jgi:chromosomal replication initiation ATPase DnaA
VKTDRQLDEEIARLEIRIKKLRTLRRLQAEANNLELKNERGTLLEKIAAAILEMVIHHYGIGSVERLMLQDRTAKYLWPRNAAAKLIRQECGFSYTELARLFGGRDHGTMMNACLRVEERLSIPGGAEAIWAEDFRGLETKVKEAIAGILGPDNTVEVPFDGRESTG